jgi:hypothetical protein
MNHIIQNKNNDKERNEKKRSINYYFSRVDMI